MNQLIAGLFFIISFNLNAQQDFVRDTSFSPPFCIKGVESMIEGENGSLYHLGASNGTCSYLEPGAPLIDQDGIVKLMIDASYDSSFISHLTFSSSVMERGYLTMGDSVIYVHQNFGAKGLFAMRYNGDFTDTIPTKLSELNDSTNFKFDWFSKFYSGVGNFCKLDDGTFILSGDLAVRHFDLPPVTIAHVLKFDERKLPDSTFIVGKVSFESGIIVPSVRRTFPQGDKVLITGYFDSYNGYFSPGLVRIYKSGEVDTTFRSPFQRCEVVNASLDLNGKFLMSGGGTIINEQDTIYTSFWRINSNGSIDSSFNFKTNIGLYHVAVNKNYFAKGVFISCEWLELHNGYLIFTQGVTNTPEIQATYQGLQRSQMVLDENGFILPQYFQNIEFLGFTQPLCLESNHPNLIPNEYYQIASLMKAGDGRVFVGGYYCGFNGEYVAGSIMAFFPPETLLSNAYKSKPLRSDLVIAYPNPANEYYHIEALDSKNIRPDLSFFDATGKVLITLTAVPLPYNFDVSGYVPGMYYLQVKDSNQYQVLKVVVSKH
ncbi:MAG: T9SS type A sorting domain-containing protein [Saprospiraceae bacterium]